MRLHKVILPLLLVTTLLVAFGCAPDRPTNVILIVVDTLRADHLGFYGYDRPTSPELDEWASRGLVFEQALAPSPWTLPTFGSILTGLSPLQHGAGARYQSEKKWRRSPMSGEVATLPEILRRQGFTTGAIVNNPFLREHFGAARGFDVYDYEKGRQADTVVDLAQEWIAARQDRPFFLMVHLIDPHLPYDAPESVAGKFGAVSSPSLTTRGRKSIIEKLSDLTGAEREAIGIRYDEEVAFVDRELGRLLAFLEQQSLWERTLVVLTSDHGEELFDHGGFEHGHSMFQELLRVPLVFWGPGVEAGRQALPVSLHDLTPTIVAAVGGTVPEGLAGVSLWQDIRQGKGLPRRDFLAQNTLWGRERQAVVAWPYKLILEPKSQWKQLFNLDVDPGETRNLVEDEPEIASALEKRLRERLLALESNRVEEGVALTPEMEEELRALGYLD
jgi:choline-sulfatase